MEQQIKYILNRAVIVLLVFQLSGCGTLLYPERRGNKAGHLDVGVVILDGIGLLFFLIPGIIAFAVDFSSGCIYLPAGSRADAKQIKFDPKKTTLAEVEDIIKKETGRSVKLTAENVKVTRLHSTDEIAIQMAKSMAEIDNRLALAN